MCVVADSKTIHVAGYPYERVDLCPDGICYQRSLSFLMVAVFFQVASYDLLGAQYITMHYTCETYLVGSSTH